MKVFIESDPSKKLKNIFNEKTLEFKKSVSVSMEYPFPYGFILNTTSEDGDNLDCFLITKRPVRSRDIVEVEPIGVLEQIDDGEEDHNILAKFADEDIELTEEHKESLRHFLSHVFDHLPDKVVTVGEFLDKEAAEKLIQKSLD